MKIISSMSFLSRAKKLIEKYDNIVLFHHIIPDGDCMATSFGLMEAIRKTYPNKNIKVAADIKDFAPRLKYMDKYVNWKDTCLKWDGKTFLAIIGDNAIKERVAHYEEFLPNASDVIVFDHHENGTDIKYTIYWSEPNCKASAIQAYQISDYMKLNIDSSAAIIIYNGIITDTGTFSFSGNDPVPLEISSKLISIPTNDEINEYHASATSKDIKMVDFDGWYLTNYRKEDIDGGGMIWNIVTTNDLNTHKMTPNGVNGKVYLLQNIKNYIVWMQFTEFPTHDVKVEFRSNVIDVNVVAEKFGGGGHEKASGCKLDSMDQIDDVLVEVKKELLKRLKK